MITVDDFLINGYRGKVALVNTKQLDRYIRNSRAIEMKLDEELKIKQRLLHRIYSLKAKIAVLELETPPTIDLGV